eukprot:scaffold18804_cov101-Isochrysis_galbana.AAC.1
MQLDRDEGRGLSRSLVARTRTGRGACSDECEVPPKRTSDGKALFSPALARKTHLEQPGVMRSPKPPGGAQITKIKNRETKCTRPQIARREREAT